MTSTTGFKEIGNFFDIYKNSAWEKDAKAMADLYSDEAILFDMWDDGYISDASKWAAVIENWLGSLGDEKVKVDFEMINIHQSGDVGFANALIQFQAIAKDDSVLRTMKNRITIGCAKFGDSWKVMHQHTSAPVSSNGLKAILDI